MRKAFIEPDMKVIKLNLNENIATSGNEEREMKTQFGFVFSIVNDIVVNTDQTENQVLEILGVTPVTYDFEEEILAVYEKYVPGMSSCRKR